MPNESDHSYDRGEKVPQKKGGGWTQKVKAYSNKRKKAEKLARRKNRGKKFNHN